jgi:endonuclease/exonuclease/phosphatase family metal-dependent hydrolase
VEVPSSHCCEWFLTVMIVPPESSLSLDSGISVLSYNILLPNSSQGDNGGGWWVYKMYSPRHKLLLTESEPSFVHWDYRQQLMKEIIATSQCDIVCLQEVRPESHEQDFNYMSALGYDQSEIYRKGEFCPMIFWKSNKVTAISPPVHRDRCLIIAFESTIKEQQRTVPDERKIEEINLQLPLYICNCHLQAGVDNSERRFRQVFDALDTIRKHAVKLITSHLQFVKQQKKKKGKKKVKSGIQGGDQEEKESSLSLKTECGKVTEEESDDQFMKRALKSTPIVLLGDMNCDPVDSCGSHSLLVYGKATVEGKVLPPEEREESVRPPTIDQNELSIKNHPFEPFIDAYEFAYRRGTEPSCDPPPTMIVEELYDVLTIPMVDASMAPSTSSLLTPLAQYDLQLSPLALERLELMFNKYAQTTIPPLFSQETLDLHEGVRVMSDQDTKRWLTEINKVWSRGSEYRAAIIRMKSLLLQPRPSSSVSETEIPPPVTPPPPPMGCDQPPDEGEPSKPKMPPNSYLGWPEFRSIYEQMIAEGKVWAVSSDLATSGFPLPMSSRVFTARYDRVYLSGALKEHLSLIRDLPCGSIEEGCLGVGGCLPNEFHPSDHLPVAVSFTLPQTTHPH